MMTNAKKKRIMKYRQKKLNQMFANLFVINLIIVFVILFSAMVRACQNNQIEGETKLTVYESNTVIKFDDHNTVIPPANVLPSTFAPLVNETKNEQVQETIPEVVEYDRGLTKEEKYLLAKIAMAEAEGESLETKVLIVLTVLNRVYSDKPYFPDSVEEVIFQKTNGVYQFTPIGNGRWDRVEPNDECWEAVEIVNSTEYDFSQGALYFESCKGESWHSRNLEFICQSDNTRFYK